MTTQLNTKRPWLNKNILSFSIASFLGDVSYEMAFPALPLFVTALVGSYAAPPYMGFISGISDASANLCKLIFGPLSDRVVKRKPFLVAGYLASAVFIGLIGAAQNVWQILMFRTSERIGKSLREPARDALITESVSQQYYGKAFGFHRAMDTLGAIVGPLGMFFALKYFSLRTIFLLACIPGFGAVFAIILLTRELPRISSTSNKYTLSFKELPVRFKHFVAILFIFGIAYFSRSLLLLRIRDFLSPTYTAHFIDSVLVLLYTLFSAIRALSEYYIGGLSDTYGRRKIFAYVGMLLFGITSLVLALPLQGLLVSLIIFVIMGISVGTYTAVEKAYAADMLPLHIRGTGYGLLQAVVGISNFISSVMVGYLWTAVSPTVAFTYAAILSSAAAFLLLRLPDVQK